MPRSRKVEADTALQSAQIAFRELGFDGLGTRELEERTGITRFTLQTSYGGKKALYLRTLDAYLDAFEAFATPFFGQGGLSEIAGFFRNRVSGGDADDMRFGCSALNALMEFGGRDAEVNMRRDRYLHLWRDCFSAALSNAKRTGMCASTLNIEMETEHLLAGVLGLNALIRAFGANQAGANMANALAQHVEALAR